MPEPENRHDPRAVRVDVAADERTETVGYLARDYARSYQPALLSLSQAGFVGTCPARITGGSAGRCYGVYLHLAGPDALLLANLTTERDLLEPEWQVTVTRDEHHQATLARRHSPARSVTRVVAELASSTVTGGKYRGDYAIEVRVDGERVGELTAAMSSRYRDLVAAPGLDVSPACEAVITHGERGYQIDLRLPAAR